MTYPLVSELADAGIPVAVACRLLKVARQPYHRWRNDPVRAADVLRAYRINALHDAHHDDPTFGYRYLAGEARRAGWRMSRRTAWKLGSQAGILSSAQRRRRGKGKKAGPPVFDDHVQRVFRADHPTGSGSRTSRSIARAKASSTAAGSKTCPPTASSDTRSATG